MSARILQGVVVSDKMDKTVVVNVARRKQHPLYRKVINRSRRFKAHDAANECNIGDVVRILETSPISKDKHWRVIEILERGDVAEVSPEDIGRTLEEEVQAAPSGGAGTETGTGTGTGTGTNAVAEGEDAS